MTRAGLSLRLSLVALAALTVGACAKSDESLAEAARAATRPAEVFLNVCFNTQADPERVKHIAALNKWEVGEREPVGKDSISWKLTVGGHMVILLEGSGPDDRPKVPAGKTLHMCGIRIDPAQEPSFVADLQGLIDLKKIDPAKFVFTRNDGNTTALSESGAEDGSFEVLLGPQSAVAGKAN